MQSAEAQAEQLEVLKLETLTDVDALPYLHGMREMLSMDQNNFSAMQKRCMDTYAEFQALKGSEQEWVIFRLIGQIKAIRLVMIENGHSVRDPALSALWELESSMLEFKINKAKIANVLDEVKTSYEQGLVAIQNNPEQQRNAPVSTGMLDLRKALETLPESAVGDLALVQSAKAELGNVIQVMHAAGRGVLTVRSGEWNLVNKIIGGRAGGEFIISRDKVQSKEGKLLLNCSFLVVDKTPYAFKEGVYRAKGASGTVTIVQNEKNETFALKTQPIDHPHYKTDQEKEMRIQELETEKTILETLNKMHAFCRLNGQEFSIMALEPGEDILKGFISTGRLAQDPKLRQEAALGCLKAVKALHDDGIMHGDIKPENFMMDIKDGVVVVKAIDFGHGQIFSLGAGTAKKAGPKTYDDYRSVANDLSFLGRMLKEDFNIDIPTMCVSSKIDEMPTIEDVIAYVEARPAITFDQWKEAQSKTQLDPSAALVQAAAQVSNEAAAIAQLSGTHEAPTTSSPALTLHFSSAGTTATISPPSSPTAQFGITADGKKAPPPPGYIAGGKKAPPPPPRQVEEDSWEKARVPVMHVRDEKNDDKPKPGG